VSDLGTRLREARESRGLTLQQVEEQLRIRHAFLEALEEERYEALPGAVYTRGFIQNYGRLLGLPVDELLQQYGGATEVPVRPATRIPTVIDEPLLSTPTRSVWPQVFLGVMIALALLVAGWYGYARLYLDEDPVDALRRYGLFASILPPAEEGPVVAASPTAPSQAGLVETPPPAAEGTPLPAPTEAPTTEPAPTQAEAVPTPTPRHTLTPTPTATPTVEAPPEGEAPGTDEATPPPADAVTVVARVIETAWVSVVIDGTQVLATTLQPGQEYTWLGADDIALRVGNAGGLDLTVNGEAVGTLGASGEVVDITYTRPATP